MNRITTAASLIACFGLCAAAFADQYDPPAGYYAGATSTSGPTLKSQLHAIISTDYWTPGSTSQRVLNYTSQSPVALAICARLGVEPNSPSQILIYNGQIHQKNWDNGNTWNKEHTWPQSRGVGSTGPDFSDTHMLRPCNSSLNSSRSNLPYGTSGSEWDPNHAVGVHDRGECARALFYADTRYDGGEPDTTDLTLVNGSPSGNQMGDLSEIFKWHYDEGPTWRERRRNQLIFSNNPWDWEDTQINPEITIPGFERPPLSYHQGNRNPFIDHPEYAWPIWGVPTYGANNSTLYVGGSFGPDGSSSTSVDLGRAILGATASSSVGVNKDGSHGTTWIVSVTGAAFSDDDSIARTYPFVVSPPSIPQPTVSVGIDTSLGTYGVQNGQVIIDNTDLTSTGLGHGSQDADDVIDVQVEAVDHADASFAELSDVNSIVVNFGTVPQNASVDALDYAVWNRVSVNGATAHLDVDSVGGVGNTSVVSIDLSPTSNVLAGQSVPFQAHLNSSAAPGPYQSVYTINVSDENIPGATSLGSITVTVVATIAPACAGDVNGDGMTNSADFNILAGNFGGGPGLTRAQGDLTGDGFVNSSDFNVLAGDFGCQ